MAEQNLSVSEITTDVNVGMDEVVSVFLTRYEDDLFEKKARLSKSLKELKAENTKQDKRLEGSVDTTPYEQTIQSLGIKSSTNGVNVNWSEKEQTLNIHIKIEDLGDESRYNSSFTKTVKVDISEFEVGERNSRDSEIEELNSELVEVMSQIKSVSRKERQVRGRISEMKLKESGLSGLLENDEMLKLIQVD